MRRFIYLLIPLCLLFLILPVTALASPSYDQAVDKLVSDGYPQKIENYLNSLGTNPALGFRWAGTSADNAGARYLAEELSKAGLSDVHLEQVPLDVFEFKSASVTARGRVMTASTFAGVPPTLAGGASGDVVYVKNGSAPEFDAAGDVRDKIVLVDLAMASWWFDFPGAEAAHRGAKAVIATYNPADPSYYSIDANALGSFDATYNFDWAPMVYVSKTDGDWLKAELQKGPVKATVQNHIRVTMASDGGKGYNVVATIHGSAQDGQMVVISAHHDAHFRAGMDDTAAVANALLSAKAMRMSGYRPAHDIVFLLTTGEEFGYTNCYYDWLAGAWYAITHEHTNWPGKIRAMINLELMGLKDAPVELRSNEELSRGLKKLLAGNTSLTPYGAHVTTPVYSWNDQWPFTAAGVPSVEFSTSNDYYDTMYHTNFEVAGNVEWPYIGSIAKLVYRVETGFDSGLLPYAFIQRADSLAASVKAGDLRAAGANGTLVNRLAKDILAFTAAAEAYDARASGSSGGGTDDTNIALLGIEKRILSSFTALDAYDYTVYPHEQVTIDLQGLNLAIAALQISPPDAQAALSALLGVSQTWYGANFSLEVFQQDQARHKPKYDRLTWGGQGHLAPYIDVMSEYRAIERGEYAAAAASLVKVRGSEIAVLNARLTKIASVLEVVTPEITALR